MTKAERKKLKAKIKMSKPVTRLDLPRNKRHKTAKDYKRKNKVKLHEIDQD
jgi:hypothetical protein